MEGKLLKSKYRIERRIAKGGMSTVYLCTNIELGNKWIAKEIEKKYSNYIYEEEILKRLYHISLPKIVDICRDETGIFIIESYIEGISLLKLMTNIGGLELDKVIDYSLQLCEVLTYLHNMKPKPIIHKDLKPSNIIVTEGDKLVLVDFGIAEEQGGDLMGLRAGTNAYAPPEQLANSGICDTRGDIYSYGIILIQLVTGELIGRTYGAKELSISNIHKKLLDIGEKCTAFLPEDRYQKVEEIRENLIEARDRLIAAKESKKIKQKLAMIFIVILSLLSYILSIIGIIVF
ncbi:MAG: serine/threonine-protein kinase [Lutisporaceae bacterium]